MVDRDEPADPPDAGRVDISVVVPAHQGQRTIVDCLESIERATRDRQREIIVVDSSKDSTPEIIRERFPGVILIHYGTRLSAGEARNVGAAIARGRLVFFADQDCVVPEDWVDRLEAHFQDTTVHAAGGAVAIRNLYSASGCALYFLEFLYHFPENGPARQDANFLVGCNSAYRAETVRAVRFPDQTLGEDVLFTQRLRDQGWRTVYDARIAVLHQNKQGWGTFFAYNHKMGRAAAAYHALLQRNRARVFLRHPMLAFAVPMVILPTIALSLLRSRPSYLIRFLLLAPACLLGNLCWASGFRAQARETQRRTAESRRWVRTRTAPTVAESTNAIPRF
jgi:GT2 family glycosyltransferase